ncbi:MAG TPA: methionine--tRNA ligase [Candidatus Saccharimonadales bacterium]|nr:methionine--tRNA ligase [Candidatus Saccharimonadales bacterium]
MKSFFVTTSIPYVNSDPHIGFGMELVMADVLARWARQGKRPTMFLTGTDEHGGKIAEKAAEAKTTPKAYADQVSQKFSQLSKTLNISNDRFIRTTDPEHEQRAQTIWKNLASHIYKGTYVGWYCTGHEEYFPETIVKENKGVCPEHNRPYEKLQEENYFFKLSAFTEPVKEAIDTGKLRVIPDSRRNEIMAVLDKGLEDISISRPKDKISWGIGVPGDTGQVMYVWFEALTNYITALGYPDGKDFKEFWPADVQIIGKDILRFHAAIWPAMLMGLELAPPKTLYAHGFISSDGKKMSKTLGNVVAPADITDKFGADTFRYYFLRHIPSNEDGDFSWEKLESAYNNELADQLGNAVARISAMIERYQQGVIGQIPPPEHDVRAYEEALEDCRFDLALSEVWEQIRGLNQYVDEQKPWQIAKDGDEDHLREVLAYMAGSLLEVSELLAPFMPETAQKINSVFSEGILKPLPGPLFPKHEEPKK